MAAVLSSDMDNTDKVVMLIEECRVMKLKIKPPDINASAYRFTIDENDQIIYGIGAIKGVGEAAIEDLIGERTDKGVFTGLHDLCKRVDLRKVNRRVFEALIRAGAFDEFDTNRAGLMAELPRAQKIAEQHSRMILVGQNDLFGLDADADGYQQQLSRTAAPTWSEKERLASEKQALGLYLTGHPIEQYAPEIAKITHGTIASMLAKIENSRNKAEARIAGLVVELRTRQTRQGKTMGFAMLDDRTGRLEVALFNDVFDKYRDILSANDEPIIVEGSLGIDHYSGGLRLVAEKLYSMEQARTEFARSININWPVVDGNQETDSSIDTLLSILQPYCGGKCPVVIYYQSAKAKTAVQLGDDWRIHPTEDVISRLRNSKEFPVVEIKY